MKAYEFPVKVTSEGKLELPDSLLSRLPRGEAVRVIILVDEPADIEEDTAWNRLTAERFLAGYSNADSVYDAID